jgi:hypothetical protein
MKAKSYPPRNSDKKKVVPIHALMIQEEYPSGDDASDDEEVGRAAIAIAKPTSLSSLFASANESKRTNNKATCLMAHAIKVSPTLTPIIPRNLSLMDCVDTSDDKDELSEMDIFMSTLHGETKARFEILLDQYNESFQLNDKNEERIFELEGHACAYVMTLKYRGSIIVLLINKSVEPNEEQKVLTSSFDQGFTVNTSKQVFRGIW